MDTSKSEQDKSDGVEELEPKIRLDADDAEAVKGGAGLDYNPKELGGRVKWSGPDLDAIKGPQ